MNANKYKQKFLLTILRKNSWAFILLGIASVVYFYFALQTDFTETSLFCTFGYLMFASFLLLAVGSYSFGAIKSAFKLVTERSEYFKGKYGDDVFALLNSSNTKVLFRQKAWSIDTKLSLINNDYILFEDMALMYVVMLNLDELESVEYYQEGNSAKIYLSYIKQGEVVEEIMNFSNVDLAEPEFLEFIKSLPNFREISKKEYMQKLKKFLGKND